MYWRNKRPLLSIVLIVYDMPAQALRTLQSLLPPYQRNVTLGDYEIIVVENASARALSQQTVEAAGSNVRYFRRAETQRTPVHAINFGARQARGSHVAIMIDGARLLSPGVVRLTLDALRISPKGIVITPGYHLGNKLQQEAVNEGYDEQVEAGLMGGIAWPEDGYRLFDISVFSGSCRGGFFAPIAESNFIACSQDAWKAVGGMEPRFDDFGGGYANLDLYSRLVNDLASPCYLLFGEGTFHQFHGGVTTGTRGEERQRIAQSIRDQYATLRGVEHRSPRIEPVYFGTLSSQALRFVRKSLPTQRDD
jgi:glycosyltransferase involved in cell wall biosynthesis